MISTPLFLDRASWFHLRRRAPLLLLAAVTIFALGPQDLRAGSAAWNVTPASSDWNSSSNWTPTTIPSHPGDTATFHSSAITSLTLSRSITLDAAVFASDASVFTINIPAGRAMNFRRPGRF